MKTVVAIDGPAASGKSSVARKVSAQLGFSYIDSGAFYRAITWWILRCQADPESHDAGVRRHRREQDRVRLRTQ